MSAAGRRPLVEVEHARSLLDSLGVKEPKPFNPPTSAKIDKLVTEADAMIKSGDWSTARPVHFVALHKLLHRWCYGVECELTGMRFMAAASAATRTLNKQFDGDNACLLDFVRWSWKKERGHEEWRRQNNKPGRYLSWQRLFMWDELVTQYRIELERAKDRR